MKMERGKLASPCPRAASLHDVGEMISVNQKTTADVSQLARVVRIE